jgi:hypothetical protein
MKKISQKTRVIIGVGVLGAIASLFWHRNNMYKGYNHHKNSTTATSVYRNIREVYTLPMNKSTIEIKSGEAATIGDLVITNGGGGHKILMAENGGRGGDLSYAKLIFETPRKVKEAIRVYGSLESSNVPTVFDNYLIHTKDVGWNGETVTLEISELSGGSMVTMKMSEIKTVGNMTITFVQNKTPGTRKSSLLLEFVSGLKSMSDVFVEGQSIFFAGNLIQIKKINDSASEIELGAIQDVYQEEVSTTVSH